MATLVIITHEFDTFLFRTSKTAPVNSPYLLFDVLQQLAAMGHKVRLGRGLEPPPGDAALYHVDTTFAPKEYVDLGRNYPLTINFRTGDISKRRISRSLLEKGDPWDGPVIVKSNYNNRAVMEDIHNHRAATEGRPLPHPGVTKGAAYEVFDSVASVSDQAWADASLVVEKYIAEPDEEGFAFRTWVFIGVRERCTRFVTADRISKAAGVQKYEPVEVPEQLRAERERLGFDFGKFDFVMHNGEPILLDANRTPGIAVAIRPMMKKGALNLAEGLHGLLSGGKRPVG